MRKSEVERSVIGINSQAYFKDIQNVLKNKHMPKCLQSLQVTLLSKKIFTQQELKDNMKKVAAKSQQVIDYYLDKFEQLARKNIFNNQAIDELTKSIQKRNNEAEDINNNIVNNSNLISQYMQNQLYEKQMKGLQQKLKQLSIQVNRNEQVQRQVNKIPKYNSYLDRSLVILDEIQKKVDQKLDKFR